MVVVVEQRMERAGVRPWVREVVALWGVWVWARSRRFSLGTIEADEASQRPAAGGEMSAGAFE